ncbi:hypothetical protein [Christiangramia portivictoriae]|uniref:hypothetical protein n=1 Tax=Christiangramia portivictoriae TaxID=326069 RepID=UPI0004153633|nr:hypothetical protein [Christiangramia portivictoriae]
MKNRPSKIIKAGIKKILYKFFHLYRGKYIGIHLQGGLCNKLHCLASACEIALKEHAKLIEPKFGWKEKILFSEIYDLEHFNRSFFETTGVKDLMISREDYEKSEFQNKSVENVISLWDHSEKNLKRSRDSNSVKKDSIIIKLLYALQLQPKFEIIVEEYSHNPDYTAAQMRTESDWRRYTREFNGKGKERIYIPTEEIIDMLDDFVISGNLFFTTGEEQEHMRDLFKAKGFKADYYYDPANEYEINAAINFEICCRAKKFIGLSRSSFSNLISLKRAVILNNDQSFIYNYDHKILKRIDKGLQYKAALSISEKTVILN